MHQMTPKKLGILVVLVVLAVLAWRSYSYEYPARNAYQAVFLTNGNVYFGKLSMNRGQYVLKDVFYVQTSRAQVKDAKSDTKLIKLGDEVHGPQDAMYIERKNVILWENLRDDGKVAMAIKEFKKQKEAGAQAAPAPTTPAPAPAAQ